MTAREPRRIVSLNFRERSGAQLIRSKSILVDTIRNKSLKWVSEYSKKTLFCLFCAEFFGSATYMLMGCLGSLSHEVRYLPIRERTAIAFSVAKYTANILFGYVSRGHFNPLLTIVAVGIRNISVIEGIVYLFGQFFGSLLGYYLSKVIVSQRMFAVNLRMTGVPICCAKIKNDIPVYAAFTIEFIITFLLGLFACNRWAADSPAYDSAALAFALVYFCLILIAETFTGGHLNPFRTLAPDIIQDRFFDRNWIYYAAPMTSGILVPFIYRMVFASRNSRRSDIF